MSLQWFTLFHIAISLVGIATGFVVVGGLLSSWTLPRWTAIFLATTILTSATGYFFPVDRVLPSHVVGAISLAVLAVTLFARYGRGMAGSWRWIFVVTATISLYLNVFVLIVQMFLRFPAMSALAPTQKEPPFAIVQGAVLLAFVVIGVLCVRRFHPERAGPR